jgi:16S rRNA processing protein RimM
VPFNDPSVPEVDIAGGRIVVVPPVYDTDEDDAP